MNNNLISLKNYISIFKSRLLNKQPITDAEYMSFLDEVLSVIDLMNNNMLELDMRVKKMESKKTIPKNSSANDFVSMVLSKITILKNIIKQKIGNPTEELFSFNLTTVESIEKQIMDSGTVTKDNLEKLNKIYMSERDQI